MVAPVIKLQSVGKVFLTDEVETHALSDIDLEVATGAICMVTHDPRYARHAQRTIHLFDGRVVEQPLEMAES